MSVIISLCTQNYCAMIADKRLTINGADNKTEYIDDDTHKIFRLNERVLFGAGGTYFRNEGLTAPFAGVDCDSLTVDACKDIIVSYYNNTLCQLARLGKRRYYLCGVGDDGQMKQCVVAIDLYDRRIDVQENMPRTSSYAVNIGLPPTSDEEEQALKEAFVGRVESNNSFQDIISAAHDLICDVAKINDTVSEASEYLIIH